MWPSNYPKLSNHIYHLDLTNAMQHFVFCSYTPYVAIVNVWYFSQDCVTTILCTSVITLLHYILLLRLLPLPLDLYLPPLGVWN